MRKPKQQDESRRAVGYVRVSTDVQAQEGVSLDAQEARIRAYCTMAGLQLVELVREEGVSASTPLVERAGGAELVRLMAAHGAGHVVALKLDRLFRDAADALNTTRAWDRAGVALHLVDMGGQTLNTASAMGRLFLTMSAAFAELERNLIAERTAAALAHKKSRGEAVSRAPRGFHIERDAEGRRPVIVPDQEGKDLELVERARELRAAGLSFGRIADQLTAEGFRPKRPGAGARIAPQTVGYMIRNPRPLLAVA
jgi:DNA invertase Pin-like site-specific DNA recombinase